MFLKIGILKNFANFTRKHLCLGLFLIELEVFFTEHLWWLLLSSPDWNHECFPFFVHFISWFKINLRGGIFCFEKPLGKFLTLLRSICSYCLIFNTLCKFQFLVKLLGLPMVKFSQGIERVIKREKFIMKTGSTVVTRVQLPLKLAWAISIHKSQVKNTV